ncbi:MAG: hypothetical protein JWP37_3602, partial [Mucilaginibacter sp.]|nr:hypothetical protein [Mucilaginibacter sp.]
LAAAYAPIEIANSLAPYLLIYDKQGNIVATSATLNGKPPIVPRGVLEYVQKHGADKGTWQPQPGMRQACAGIQTNANKAYTVITGRSLRTTEERITLLGEQVLFGWAMSLLAMLVVVTLQEVAMKRITQEVMV